jgi:hypothetical protein
MGFSQEVVQEFQISAANFDLATGITDAGAVNVITRPEAMPSTARASFLPRP